MVKAAIVPNSVTTTTFLCTSYALLQHYAAGTEIMPDSGIVALFFLSVSSLARVD
ncbi:hypothetical protein [Snodgrassella alvi]|jgi:hypothetical protein|uniref:hypothetical protein n=1 Tax=Snodgrassella alvi TaxID=1196083 RepID=UPI0015D551F0|nr:hypothetical protein [Snodgrassella alvi]